MFVNGGGYTGNYGGYKTDLVKAEKQGKNIYLYEKVILEKKIYDQGPNQNVLGQTSTEEFKMVYTFELEDDGMYKFVSRVKKDK